MRFFPPCGSTLLSCRNRPCDTAQHHSMSSDDRSHTGMRDEDGLTPAQWARAKHLQQDRVSQERIQEARTSSVLIGSERVGPWQLGQRSSRGIWSHVLPVRGRSTPSCGASTLVSGHSPRKMHGRARGGKMARACAVTPRQLLPPISCATSRSTAVASRTKPLLWPSRAQ